MEVITKQMYLNEKPRKILHQFQVNEDVNVSDTKEDVVYIVKGELCTSIKEVQLVEEYIKVSGVARYFLLYMTDSMDNKLSCLEGEIPFEEMIFVEGKDYNRYSVDTSTLEFHPTLIHSRKIGLKIMIELAVEKMGTVEEELTVDILGDAEESLHKKMKTMTVLQTMSTQKDAYRIKEQFKIPGTKENIGNVLYFAIESYKLDFKAGEDELLFAGEIQVFCIYVSDEWKEDWVNQTVSFRGRVDCYGVDEEKYHNIRTQIEGLSLEPQMDEDGEMRLLGVEATLKMDIEIMGEEEIELIEDAYALDKKCVLKNKDFTMESLLLQSQSKCKIAENMNVPELSEEILQVCHSTGAIQIESIDIVEDGIAVDGILNLSFLYVRSNEEKPYGSWKGMVPFSHIVECKTTDDLHFDMHNNLEQLSVVMTGNKEIEVKAVIAFQSIIKKPETIHVIEKMEIESYSKQEMEDQAGIIGYIYKEEDDLWNLAKKYHTTQKSIMEINDLSEKEVKPGTRLLIFKENMSIL